MDFLSAVVLGLVEGVTEFLPVSSTGHLILFNSWFAFSESFTKLFDVVIQFGAILAVIVVFWKKFWPVNVTNIAVMKRVAVAVLPALVVGALVGSKIQKALFHPIVVACALVVGGIALLLVEKTHRKTTVHSLETLSYPQALIIGFMQCLAFIPGTSRSAATIVGALLLGTSRVAATEFSFFLAVPTMAAASAFSLLKGGVSLTGHEALVLGLGFVTAFVSALVVIRLFLTFVQTKTFIPFAYYRIVLGVLLILFLLR